MAAYGYKQGEELRRGRVTLEIRECGNGETFECFFAVDEEPIFNSQGVGQFLTEPTLAEAFAGAIKTALDENASWELNAR